jgi:glycolate oxidase FAD binding subunit
MTGEIERIAPTSAEDAAAFLAACDGAGRTVAIEGGGTLSGIGLPIETDALISTAKLKAMIAHEHADLTASVQAGMTLRAFSDALAKYDQFVPLDAPLRKRATVGGTLAAGWAGPRRHLYGRARDYVIGTRIALADGTLANAGGMVVKNVTGYDMSKLYVGSCGTLGVLISANLKTLPAPKAARAFHHPLPLNSRARAIAQLQTMTTTPAAAFWVEGFAKEIGGNDADDGRLFVLMEGSSALLDRATRDLRSGLGKAGVPETHVVDAGASDAFERAVDAYVAGIDERSVTYRSNGDPSDVEARTLAMRALAHRFELRADLLCDVMNGDAILRVSDSDARSFAAKIEIFDDALHDDVPNAQVIASTFAGRRNLNVWGALPPAIEMMRSLKARFDPNRTLNPGRFVGGI